MIRRAMTMIETLVALALCSAVVVAAAEWLSFATTTSTELSAKVRWETAARATLELIADDLASRDDREYTERQSMIAIDDDRLTINTRTTSPTVDGRVSSISYQLDPRSNTLNRAQTNQHAETPPLLGEVSAFRTELNERLLLVTIESPAGWVAERSYLLDALIDDSSAKP